MAESSDEGFSTDAIITDFSKAFDLVPHDRLLTKVAASDVVSRVVVWFREFLVGHTQRVRVGGQLSKEVKVTSGVLQGSVLGPLLFLVYVNDIWRNIDSSINPLKPELNSICYLLALLGAHHFLHVSRIRVKLLTFRLLMSYIWSTHS